MTTARGNRITLPDNPLRVCAACLAPRGNTRKGWEPITRDGHVVGWTCPACPRADEPVRRLASGRFRAVVDATPPGARQRRQVTRTVDTLDEAREWVADVRAQVERAGRFAAPDVETVAALCTRWLRSRRDVRPVTRDGYRNVLAPAMRVIGTRDVRGVTVADVEALVETLASQGGKRGQPLGPRSVRAALVALAQAFDVAAREGAVSSNPVRLARRPRFRKRVGRDLEHWQPSDLLRFRDVADSDPLAGAWRLTLCGLTRADVMGLRWADVDLDAGLVSVSQGRVALDHGSATDDPKSAQRVRAVPVEAIHPGTIAQLRGLRTRQAADRLRAGAAYRGASDGSGYVVVDELGTPLRPEVYSDRFRRLTATAGVPPITLHSVRHSLAFWLHQLGVAPADAAALLGHTVEVHLATYLPHSGAAGITAAARALGAAGKAAAAGSER